MGQNKTENKVEKDKCILCGCETPYDKDEHINKRFCYVECAGQLCQPCWKKIYGSGNFHILG
tara:strand:- start:260 stop:445 length:186 start_codon:yes stop_codon:yes gene_type:complete